ARGRPPGRRQADPGHAGGSLRADRRPHVDILPDEAVQRSADARVPGEVTFDVVPAFAGTTWNFRIVTATHSATATSARSCALRGGIHGIERLARGHEQTVALGAAEADVAAYLGQTDTADELAVRRPYRHTAIAHVAAGI